MKPLSSRPPVRRGPKSRVADWDAVAAESKANPGVWFEAVHMSSAKSDHVRRIRQGLNPAFRPAGLWDATCETQPDGTRILYVCFTGTSDE